MQECIHKKKTKKATKQIARMLTITKGRKPANYCNMAEIQDPSKQTIKLQNACFNVNVKPGNQIESVLVTKKPSMVIARMVATTEAGKQGNKIKECKQVRQQKARQ